GRGVTVVGAGCLRRRLEGIPIGRRTPEGKLVGADHVHSPREPARMLRGHLLRGRRIDHDAHVGRGVGDGGERRLEAWISAWHNTSGCAYLTDEEIGRASCRVRVMVLRSV